MGVWLWRKNWKFLLRDRFATDDPAPVASPRACEPGPGSLTVSLPAAVSVAGGALRLTDQSNITGAALDRVPGRAALARVMNNGTMYGSLNWQSTTHSIGILSSQTFVWEGGAVVTQASVMPSWTTGVWHDLALVLRSAGAFVLARPNGAARWTLVWVTASGASSPLAPGVSGRNAGSNPWFSNLRVVDLVGVWASDWGIATSRAPGSVAQGAAYAHTPDALVEFTVTTLPGAGNSARVTFREGNFAGGNYWEVGVESDGSLSLYEVVGGTPTVRGSAAAGAVVAGSRVVVIASGATITVFVNRAQALQYASATNYQSATGGRVRVLVSGVLSDLIAWPRYPAFPRVP